MLQALKERLVREHREEGFTLIELMVVVLIIAILLAIAIPTFLGARNTANARAAQSNLRNALTAEQTYYTNNQSFGAASGMTTIEPNLSWEGSIGALSTTGSTVWVSASGDDVLLTALGADHNCYSIAQLNQPISASIPSGTYYNETAANAPGSTGGYTCTAPSLPAAAPTAGSAASNPGAGKWYTQF